jgi:DNA primase catalytic subunit
MLLFSLLHIHYTPNCKTICCLSTFTGVQVKMKQSIAIEWYSRLEVRAELVRVAQDREIGVQLQGGRYGKRPDVLQFPKEVESMARKGATSFHVSQERWLDPMRLSSDSTKRELDNLRKGWDLIIDIDCAHFDYSTLAAETVVEALEVEGIKPQVKFSGNRGWHIAIPFEAFPEQIGKQNVKDLYEKASSAILMYLQRRINKQLWHKIKNKEGDLRKVVEKIGKKPTGENISKYIGLDLQLGASRHLIRAPHSLHEKTGLVSLTINPEQILKFNKEWAKPENIKEINNSFLNTKKIVEGSAVELLSSALIEQKQYEVEEETKSEQKHIMTIEGKIVEERFPPCIKLILAGIQDGKKRALFALLNFLKCCNWTWDEIEQKIKEWNDKNPEPLKKGYIIAQLNWHRRNPKKVPPQNCKEYYQEIGVCEPDATCNGIKNPLNYVKRVQFKDKNTKKKSTKKNN